MPTVAQRLLRESIERIGAERVASTLELTPLSLESFRVGQRPIPDVILLKLIDIIDSLPKKEI
jgi:hypothetical protein